MLGGAGSDTIIGGGGNDIIDGDAWLHVGLTSYSAGGHDHPPDPYDPNGNTYDPATANGAFDAQRLVDADGNHRPGTAGHVNAANVDTAVYNDVLADYDIALFGPDAEGFLTIDHARAGAPIVGGNPQGLLGGDDGTDRIRNIERLQFTDGTVAIDKNGNILTSSDGRFIDPIAAANPIGGDPTTTRFRSARRRSPRPTRPATSVDPTVLAEVGDTLHASVASHHRRRRHQHPGQSAVAGAGLLLGRLAADRRRDRRGLQDHLVPGRQSHCG